MDICQYMYRVICMYMCTYMVYMYILMTGEGIIILASELAFFRVFSLWEISQTNGVNVKF